MNATLRSDAEQIVRDAIAAVCPDEAVKRALKGLTFSGRVFLVAVGKAAWQMASTAVRCLAKPVAGGIVITKYGHVKGEIPGVSCYEAGHPIPDENTLIATQQVLQQTAKLRANDTVLFLLSGGGSALFESPLVSLEELQVITDELLASGADIVDINTIRKRLSSVKGGKFAAWCAPAHVESVILSDILGDPVDMIASGPAAPDSSTCKQAMEIAKKYQLTLSEKATAALVCETPKQVTNVHVQIIGSVRELCRFAAESCRKLGYEPFLLTNQLCCEAREAGSFLASILKTHAGSGRKLAFLAGGETVVHLTGNGSGGRNQELVLGAAPGLAWMSGAAVISVGSDGTDGPTNAAGGYVDGETMMSLKGKGMDLFAELANNNAYVALDSVGGLIFTGPTGTNVNDISVALLNEKT